jgi:hypothetical protein
MTIGLIKIPAPLNANRLASGNGHRKMTRTDKRKGPGAWRQI